MSYNFVLYEAVVQALRDAVEDEIHDMADDQFATPDAMRLRLGCIRGLKRAIEIAEETEQKVMER